MARVVKSPQLTEWQRFASCVPICIYLFTVAKTIASQWLQRLFLVAITFCETFLCEKELLSSVGERLCDPE